MKRALISVSNKDGIVDFARGIENLGYDIISTGGTFRTIREAGIKVTQVAEVTGFPEILNGRVKTLHPKIHGGILARRTPEHMQQLSENQIDTIDIVVVNLYPFRETISKPDVTLPEAIENIDIGGPSMVRSAAKNYEDVIIIVEPDDYRAVLEELKNKGNISRENRLKLALKAFSHTASYDSMISSYLSQAAVKQKDQYATPDFFGPFLKEIEDELNEEEPQPDMLFPERFTITGTRVYELRYGENPHQKACFYTSDTKETGLPGAIQLNGKELSYNNIIDTQAAWALAREFTKPACVIVKHTNPCGTGVAARLDEAYDKAFAGDPVSAYGGIIAFNRAVDLVTAQKAAGPFMEVIIAPGYDEDALECLKAKPNLRLLELPITGGDRLQVKSVDGGFVVQESDTIELDLNNLKVVTETAPTKNQLEEMVLAWKVVGHVKSNAIVIAKDDMIIGVGAGQMNRVGSAAIALENGKEKCEGAVMASDAFFPFKDTVEIAAQYGIKAIIQPGGSIRDQESIDECNKNGIAMVFTGTRHFKH